jgi:hypothetical protein
MNDLQYRVSAAWNVSQSDAVLVLHGGADAESIHPNRRYSQRSTIRLQYHRYMILIKKCLIS